MYCRQSLAFCGTLRAAMRFFACFSAFFNCFACCRRSLAAFLFSRFNDFSCARKDSNTLGSMGKSACFFGKTKKAESVRTRLLLFLTAIFGPSGESRTHGLLNPIQARYQTALHPDVTVVPTGNIYYYREKAKNVNCFFKKIRNKLSPDAASRKNIAKFSHVVSFMI